MAAIHAEYHAPYKTREEALEWARQPEVDWVNEKPRSPHGWSWVNHGEDTSFLMSWGDELDITENDVK